MATPPRLHSLEAGRVLVFDSATYVEGHVAATPGIAGDVVVNASYSGVLCARMVMSAKPRAAIGLDCAIGKDGAGQGAGVRHDACLRTRGRPRG